MKKTITIFIVVILYTLSLFSIIALVKFVLKKEVGIASIEYKNSVVFEKKSNKKFTGILVEKYSTNEIKSKKEYKDGILNGKFEQYYKNNTIYETSSYINGKLNGLSKTYYKSGKIYQIVRYVDNKIIDISEYTETGVKK